MHKTLSHITTHVLDTALGRPAQGIHVVLEDQSGSELAAATTDQDGRVADLGPQRLDSGTYRLRFATGPYLEANGTVCTFFPEVILSFHVDAAEAHYHVPLLLSPFGYSTYRGS